MLNKPPPAPTEPAPAAPKLRKASSRSAIKPFSHDQLVKATVLKKESREGFQELVRQYMRRIAPRDPVEQAAVEEICSATWRLYRVHAIERRADDIECLLHACGALAGKNPDFHLLLQRQEIRLQNIIRRSLARIQALRRIGPQIRFGQIALVELPSGRASHAPEP